MSSFPNTERRQCEPAVPAPPVFSSGTRSRTASPVVPRESEVKPIPAEASMPPAPV